MLLDYTGFYGPYILFIISLYFLLSKEIYLVVFVIGFISNTLLNIVLKYIIREPRPNKDIHQFNAMIHQNKPIPFSWYGMPSGHTQMSFYSTIYMYNITKNLYILVFFSLMSIITIIQRIYYKKHSLTQCFVGSIVGSFVGYIFYVFAAAYLSNK
jgi:membrane-associated phospholipid phosphatase